MKRITRLRNKKKIQPLNENSRKTTTELIRDEKFAKLYLYLVNIALSYDVCSSNTLECINHLSVLSITFNIRNLSIVKYSKIVQ